MTTVVAWGAASVGRRGATRVTCSLPDASVRNTCTSSSGCIAWSWAIRFPRRTPRREIVHHDLLRQLPANFRLRRCRHCRRHRRRHRRHANAGLCLQCPVRLCRDLEICGACLFTSKVSLISRRGFESSQNTAPATSKRSSAFPAHRRRGASGLVRCPHIFTPSPSPHVAPLHTLVTFDDSGPVLGPQQ